MLTIYLWSQFYDSGCVDEIGGDFEIHRSFAPCCRRGEIHQGLPEGFSVKELIGKVTTESLELKRSLINPQTEDPTLNALILVNSREISVLNGLETELKDGDEVVLVPVVHGG